MLGGALTVSPLHRFAHRGKLSGTWRGCSVCRVTARRFGLIVLVWVLVVSACSGGGGGDGVRVSGDAVEVEGPGSSRVVVPAGTVSGEGRLSILPVADTRVPEGDPPVAASVLGAPIEVTLTDAQLQGTVRVEMPVDLSGLPGAEEDWLPFLARWDDQTAVWQPVPGGYDAQRGVVWAETTHLSIWRSFAWNLLELAAAIQERVQGFWDGFLGVIADPPVCGSSSSTVTWEVIPDSYDPLLLVCVEHGPGTDTATLRVVNNRAYAVLLTVGDGANLVDVDPGSLQDALWSWAAEHTPGQVYLPGAGQATFHIDVTRTPVAISSEASDETIGADMILSIGKLFIPADDEHYDKYISGMDCVYQAMAMDATEATGEDLWSVARTCLGLVIPWWGTIITGLRTVFLSTQRVADQFRGLRAQLLVTSTGLPEYEVAPDAGPRILQFDDCYPTSDPGPCHTRGVPEDFEAFFAAIASLGGEISFEVPESGETLGAYDIVIVNFCFTAATNGVIAALGDYVQGGGSLVVMGDNFCHQSSITSATAANRLTLRYGIEFTSERFGFDTGGDTWSSRIFEHPMTASVGRVYAATHATLVVTGASQVLVEIGSKPFVALYDGPGTVLAIPSVIFETNAFDAALSDNFVLWRNALSWMTEEARRKSSESVEDADLARSTRRCVIDHQSDDELNIRSGPDTGYDVVGTVPYNAVVNTPGESAPDSEGRLWWKVSYGGTEGWAAAWLLTSGPCETAEPAVLHVVDTACDDVLNVRSGPGGEYSKIGSFAPTEDNVRATGMSAVDQEGRRWLQLEYGYEVGWAASWFLSSSPDDTPTVCAVTLVPALCEQDVFGWDPNNSLGLIDLSVADGTCRSEWIPLVAMGGWGPEWWVELPYGQEPTDLATSGWRIVGDNGWSVEATALTWHKTDTWPIWYAALPLPQGVTRFAFAGHCDVTPILLDWISPEG